MLSEFRTGHCERISRAELGISEQTFYRWRQKYGGMEVLDVRRLKELEQENARLKPLVAERDLAIASAGPVSPDAGPHSAPSGPSGGALRLWAALASIRYASASSSRRTGERRSEQ